MAPEYAYWGHFSVKSDVYSFGVLVLEIVSGQKASSQNGEELDNLVGYVSIYMYIQIILLLWVRNKLLSQNIYIMIFLVGLEKMEGRNNFRYSRSDSASWFEK